MGKYEFNATNPIRLAAAWLTISMFAVFFSAFSATGAHAQPLFSKQFSPDSIGPGSTTTLTFTIDNSGSGTGVTDLAFTDSLPASVTIAVVPNASDGCVDGTLIAPAGGSSITYSGGKIGAASICTITVDVTSSTVGTHTNTTGDLTSSAGNSGTATDDLMVVTTAPGFVKSFSPSTVDLGEKSTLTFTIDNTANTGRIGNLDFTDNLPVGMEIAGPANASTTCISASAPDTTLTAVPGSSSIVLDADGSTILAGFEVLGAGAICTVTVDVVATGAGTLNNITGELLADFVSAGTASASLTVNAAALNIAKSFIDDPVVAGNNATLEFTINNFNRNFAATGVAFTDDLTTVLAGLTLDSVISNTCGGSVGGTTTISFSGGTIAPEASCLISVSLAVPAGALTGSYSNTTGFVTGTIDGSPVTGNMATDALSVQGSDGAPPLLTFDIADGNAGENVTVSFTVLNQSNSAATDVAFQLELTKVLPFPIVATLPPTPDPPCGAGSTLGFVFPDVDRQSFSLTGGSLAGNGMAGDSCTFTVDVTIPPDFPGGTYSVTSETPSATVGGSTRTGVAASDSFTINSNLNLNFIKSFASSVAPGGTVDLTFEIEVAAGSADAAAISFTDNLVSGGSNLPAGSTFTMISSNTCGGTPSGGGTSTFSYTGGTLAAGNTCQIVIPVSIPAGAAIGTYTNTTSTLSATPSGGSPITFPAASDTLNVAGLVFTKQFLTNPVLAGEALTLQFSIENQHPTEDATITFFTDNLAQELAGLAATGAPTADTCGGTLSGTTFLVYLGGSVTAGSTCTIDVPILVPASAADGTYANVTSSLSANQGGAVVVDPATDSLTVQSSQILLTKEFTDDPVGPGDPVTLQFTLTNENASQAASTIAFTDDLGATLSGLTFDSLTSNTCGATVSGTGTTNIAVSGGSLAAAGTCTITASLTVPGGATTGLYPNTTSGVTGTIGGLPVDGPAASDDLEISSTTPPTFTKSFDGPSVAGGTPVLTFSITNNDTVSTITGMAFSDDLDAVISGLVSTGISTNTCGGTGSGASLFTYSGGTLSPSTSCTVSINLQVPATATAGTFPNTSSKLFQSGIGVANGATASLTIEPPPTFAKVFAPDAIDAGSVSTLTFTIDNSASALPATALDFTDNLPAGIVVATPANASTTCTGGTVTAVSTSGVISYTGGSVAAGALCTVEASVASITAGSFVNTTGDLTSSNGNSGTATDTLTVNPVADLSVALADSADPVSVGDALAFTATVNNLGPNDATNVVATVTLPAGVTFVSTTGCVEDPNGTPTCTLGTVTSGGGENFTINVTVDAGAVPSINTTVSAAATETDPVAGNNSSTETTNVIDLPPLFSKAFVPSSIATGDISTLTFMIDNSAASTAATALDFTDNFPAAIVVATPANASTTCTGGTLTAVAGSGSANYTGGTVAAGSTCTVSVDVTSSLAGAHVNTTGDLTSSNGNSGPASDTLMVSDGPPVFAKAYSPDSIPTGGTSTLSFTIDNTTATTTASALDFTDNMPAGTEVASPSGASVTCSGGTLTAVAGSGVISYTGGSIAGGASCTISVDILGTTPGTKVNTSGDLTSSAGNSGTATDTLTVADQQPTFVKVFSPDRVRTGDSSTLTFTIDNTSASTAATSLDFTDNLPAGTEVAATPNSSVSCAGGTLTATAGSSVISYTGGTVNGGISCSINVDVTATAAGIHVNTTGDLTSSLGNSGAATATLTVTDLPPGFAKSFLPGSIVTGEISTLSFSIDNSSATTDATSLDFTDNMPAGMEVAATPNAATTCTGGTIGAVAGSGTITYSGGTVPAGVLCTVSVDVTATTAGALVNVTGDLTSSFGNSGTATDTLNVTDPVADISVVLSDDVDPVVSGNPLTYTAVVSNAGPQDATNTVATITLPAGVTFVSTTGCAEDPNGVPTCSVGTVGAGGSVNVSVQVTVDLPTSGVINASASVTSDITDSNTGNNSDSEDTTVTLAQGTVTIVKNTAPAVAGDGTFTFSSPDAEFDGLSLTTVSNTATSLAISKTAGSYLVTEDEVVGWRLDSIVCTGDADTGSVVDLPNRQVTIDVDNAEAITCTFTNVRDESFVVEHTQAVIMEFMERRADKITANSPNLVQRLKDRVPDGNKPGSLRANLDADGDGLTSNFQFSTSLAQIKSWKKSLGGIPLREPSKFDIWMETHFSHTKTTTSTSHFGLLYLGADYLVNPDFVVGGIVQFDWAGIDIPTPFSVTGEATVDGFGWMAGPYFVWRPWQNIYIDGRAAYGQSYNDVNPFGTYTDDFNTDRWLFSARITGDHKIGDFTLRPAAEVIYFHETQETYLDSLGITIPRQTLDLGRVIFGPEISYNHEFEDGSVLTPSIKLEGIYDFHRSGGAVSARAAASTDDFRGRVSLGLAYSAPGGTTFSVEGNYDGIGADGYDSYGGKIKINMPLN